MEVHVTVTDVNGAPLEDSLLTISYTSNGAEKGPFTWNINQIPDLDLADRPEIHFRVTNPDFAEEFANLTWESGGRWSTTNPAISASGVLPITITAILGCVTLAPVKTLTPGNTIKVCDNPGAVVLSPSLALKRLVYRDDRSAFEDKVRILKSPVFGPDANTAGWGKFALSAASTLTPSKKGALVWLEYGFPLPRRNQRPSILVAVWVPSEKLQSPVNPIVFFSPDTKEPFYVRDAYPYGNGYPYRWNGYMSTSSHTGLALSCKETRLLESKELVQPYPALGHFYLSANCKIVQQLLVAGRNTIVIMPIQPFSDWGPLRAKAGVGRLVREIVRFLFANSLVSTITAPRLSIILAGSSTQYFPNNLVPVPDKLPADSDLKITLAAYSAGSNAIIDILQDLLPRGAKITNPRNDLQIRQDYPPKVFASPSSFLDGQWKEYWDVDGFYNDKVGWDPAMKMLDAWHKLSSGRAMRLYHADGTTLGPPPESIPQNAIRTNVSGTLAEGTSNDGTSTWVHVSDTALKGAPEDIKTASFPAFANDDPHHMMPQLVFGHAASFPLR